MNNKQQYQAYPMHYFYILIEQSIKVPYFKFQKLTNV